MIDIDKWISENLSNDIKLVVLSLTLYRFFLTLLFLFGFNGQR